MTVRRRYVALSGGWYYSRLSDRGYQGIPGGLFARVTIPGHREGRAEGGDHMDDRHRRRHGWGAPA